VLNASAGDIDPDGLKVDGVAYTKAQADAEGWTLVF
jgi:hypothetical protein